MFGGNFDRLWAEARNPGVGSTTSTPYECGPGGSGDSRPQKGALVEHLEQGTEHYPEVRVFIGVANVLRRPPSSMVTARPPQGMASHTKESTDSTPILIGVLVNDIRECPPPSTPCVLVIAWPVGTGLTSPE